jgi:hypothetical protein
MAHADEVAVDADEVLLVALPKYPWGPSLKSVSAPRAYAADAKNYKRPNRRMEPKRREAVFGCGKNGAKSRWGNHAVRRG